jgi:ADP-ribose pyrophosphatase YjhB (NUDIX family)
MTALRLREAARVIVLDEHDRVLLRYEEHGRRFWATPGGSLEPGEDHQTAARREVREELGIPDLELGPQLAERRQDHLVGRELVRQVERYFIARVQVGTADPSHATQPDQIRAWRWWPLEELRTSDQTIYPASLAALVDAYLTRGAPQRPVTLTG